MSLTVKQKDFIRNNYLKLEYKDIALKLNIKKYDVVSFLKKENLRKREKKKTLDPEELKEDEIFMDIPNYSNYQVSNYGRIINKNTKIEIKPLINKSTKERYVILYNDSLNINKYRLIKGIVLLTFNYIKDYENYIICHNDFDVSNNRLDNLFYYRLDYASLRNYEFYQKFNSKNLSFNKIELIFQLLKENKTYFEIKEIIDIDYKYIFQIKNYGIKYIKGEEF